MDGMLGPREALKQFAAYARAVPGIRGADYPAPRQLPTKAPWVIVHWGSLQVADSGGEQTFLLGLRVHLMAGLLGETNIEIASVDDVVPRLIDAFAADRPGFHLEDPEGRMVDFCTYRPGVEAAFNAELGYGGHRYYGHELPFVIQLRRFAGDPT